MTNEHKVCSACRVPKSITDFYKRPNGTPVTACIPCTLVKQRAYQGRPDRRRIRREQNLGRSFGMTIKEYEEMLASQGGTCAICCQVPTKRLAVDHCHRTGAVRKLLCQHCNLLVGNLEKDMELAQAALKYIDQHSATNEMAR